MNTDDPKLTAYALDELDPRERAEIEELLRENPSATSEMKATRDFAVRLRSELGAAPETGLRRQQRAEILQALQRGAGASRIAWYRQPWIPSAIAATLLITTLIGLLMPSISAVKENARRVWTQPPREAVATDGGLTVSTDLASAKVPQSPAEPAPALPLSPAPTATPAPSLTAMTSPAASAPEPILLPKTPVNSAEKLKLEQRPLAAANDLPGTMAGRAGGTAQAAAKALAGPNEARSRVYGSTNTAPELRTLDRRAASASAPAKMSSMSIQGLGLLRSDVAESEVIRDGSALDSLSAGDTESYDAIIDNPFLAARANPLSTFSIDADTASYANVRRFLNANQRPPKGAVRIEELVNYFTYDYPQPRAEDSFSAVMEVATCPWEPEHRLVRIGLKGREVPRDSRPASNLVFLIDVSGSMQPANKLPLVKESLRLLVDQLGAEDTVSIAVYAGASGCVLEPTRDKAAMRHAIDRLESGGSTNGASGIQLAYDLAARSFIKGGANRVILATDGDFNVGITSQSDLVELIEKKAKRGVFLTVLGFGMGNLKDSTLEKLADKGNGNYAYIDTLAESRRMFVEQLSGTLVTIAKDVKIQVEFNPARVGSYRLIGYENRMLRKEDFNDDAKDASEIGAGHTVTALYEIVPVGKEASRPPVDGLKYGAAPAVEPAPTVKDRSPITAELLTLKLRYKAPDGDASKLLEFPLTDSGATWEKSSRDFRFAAAVASFGMLLRESPHKAGANWDSTLELAVEGKGADASGYRAEFVGLIEKARAVIR